MYDLWFVEPKPLWRIAVDLRLFQMEHDSPTSDEANRAGESTSCYINKTKLIIENLGKGLFSCLPRE